MTAQFAIALLLASSAATGASPEAGAPAEAAPKPAKPKKICKANNKQTGSRIAKKVCKTQQEWDEEEDGQEVQSKSQNY